MDDDAWNELAAGVRVLHGENAVVTTSYIAFDASEDTPPLLLEREGTRFILCAATSLRATAASVHGLARLLRALSREIGVELTVTRRGYICARVAFVPTTDAAEVVTLGQALRAVIARHVPEVAALVARVESTCTALAGYAS